jgi:hypothetical protein
MDECVLTALVRLDEAITLALVEEFYGTDRHFSFLLLRAQTPGRFVLGEA